MEKSIFYNFPITLLRHREETINYENRIIMDYRQNLINIVNYQIGELLFKKWSIEDIENDLGITLEKKDEYIKGFVPFFEKFKDKTVPVTGIEKVLCWRFINNPKDDFDWKCLWAFLAIKSIVGKKPYQKITNKLLIARMAGYASFQKLEEHFNGRPFPEHILNPDDHYKTRYALDKIKRELTRHYNVKFYGIGSRGFYATIKLTLEELITQVEKNRQKYVLAAERKTTQDIRLKVLEQLNQEKQLSSTLKEVGINAASS